MTRQLAQMRRKIESLLAADAPRREIQDAMDTMNELLYREEMLWLQRSRISWLKEGDRNTCFFHNKAVWRAKKNKIVSPKDENERVVKRQEDMKKVDCSFFNNLFLQDDSVCPNEIINLMKSKVTAAINESLTKDFSDWEIEKALFQIVPLKAPGPDGFHARFFQRNWKFLKK